MDRGTKRPFDTNRRKGQCVMPIIDPMYLYLIEVLHNLDVLNQGVSIISTIGLSAFLVFGFRGRCKGTIQAA